MNTTTITVDQPIAHRHERGITARAVSAEWIKLRTLRSTWTTLFGSVVLSTVLAAIVAASQTAQWDEMSASQQVDFDPVSAVLVGVLFVTGLIGSLGVRSIAGEHATGMIRLTHAALPHPPTVLAAKAGVVAAVSFPFALIGNLVAFAVGQRILSSKGIEASIHDPGVGRAIVFGALAVSLSAVAGVGLGSALRRTAAATSLLLVAIIGSQLIGIAVPEGARRHLPGYALQAAVSEGPATDMLAPTAGLISFAVFAAISFAVGMAATHRPAR
jgi:hypothetical protein